MYRTAEIAFPTNNLQSENAPAKKFLAIRITEKAELGVVANNRTRAFNTITHTNKNIFVMPLSGPLLQLLLYFKAPKKKCFFYINNK